MPLCEFPSLPLCASSPLRPYPDSPAPSGVIPLRRVILLALALAAQAASISLPSFAEPAPNALMRPRLGDPSRMFSVKSGSPDSVNLWTAALPDSSCSAFTAVCYASVDLSSRASWPNDSLRRVYPSCLFSYTSALSAKEGGDSAVNTITGTTSWYSVPLSSSATWAADCLPSVSDYALPSSLASSAAWKNGCYTVNIITDSDLTFLCAGVERQVAASSAVQTFTVNNCTTSRNVSIAAASADASIRLAVAVSPMHQFLGEGIFESETVTLSAGGLDTNQWVQLSLRAELLENGTICRYLLRSRSVDRTRTFADVDIVRTNSLWQARPSGTFERHSRIMFNGSSPVATGMLDPATGEELPCSVWGGRIHRGLLSDDILDIMLEQDAPRLPPPL